MNKKVYIEFTEPVGKFLPVFSWGIKLFQRTPYSHVRLRWHSNSGGEMIYEASGSRVKVIGEEAQSQFKVNVLKSYEVDVTKDEYKKLIGLFRFSSVDYGAVQAIGIGLAGWLGLKKNPLSKGRNSQVCSELLGLFMKEVKSWEIEYPLDIAGPKEIDLALESKLKTESDIRLVN